MTGARKSPKDELKVLAADVMRLSRLLTKERGGLGAAYLRDEGLRRAYVRYFLPANMYKIHIPLTELSLHPAGLLSKGRLSVLDIGSGPGTAVLGVMEFFAAKDQKPLLDFTAVDRVAENLKKAAALFASSREGYGLGASLKTVTAPMERLGDHVQGQFDVVVLSNVLNELFPGEEGSIGRRIGAVVDILDRFLSDDGSCIVVEPALRETSRELLLVRDGLLAEGFRVYAPCLINGNCPALANPKDWCHEDIPWDPPEVVKEVDRRTGLRKDSLKFSYLVLRKDALSFADVWGEGAFRVVSEPLVSKGKIEFYVCGPGGRRLVTRLDKDRTDANGAFEKLKRGDIVRFDGIRDEGTRLKAGKETAVARLRE